MRGAGPFTTELLMWYCAMLQWREMDSLQPLTLYLTLAPIFSGRKAKINLHTTSKWTVVIRIGCLLPCAVPESFVMGWGGPRQSDKKKLWQRCLFVFCFFLVLGLFYRSQMVNFKEKYHFSRFRRGSKFFQGGGGGQLLTPYRNPNNLWFSRGVRTSWPLPSGSALGCDLFSFSVRKMMRSPLGLHMCSFSCNFVHMFSVKPRNKIVSWTYCMTVAWFIQHPLQFVFAFFNHSIKIAQFLFAGGHFFSFPSHFDRWCFSSSM